MLLKMYLKSKYTEQNNGRDKWRNIVEATKTAYEEEYFYIKMFTIYDGRICASINMLQACTVFGGFTKFVFSKCKF